VTGASVQKHQYQGTVEAVLPGGDSLVHCGQDSILVANGVPGDKVLVRELRKRRGIKRGEIIKVMAPSSTRVEPSCSVAHKCGGCSFQFMPVRQQADIKSAWVKQAFKQLVQPDTQWFPVVGDTIYLRRRVRWQIGQDETGWFLGFFEPASHQPVRQDCCPVITPELQRLRRMLEQRTLSGIDAVQAVQLVDGMHVIIESATTPDSLLMNGGESVGVEIQWWWRDSHHTKPLARPVKKFHDELPVGSSSLSLVIGPDDFVQGQFEGNRALILQIQEWCGKLSRIADLFCGCGNLSLPLAALTGASVYGAEYCEASVRVASKNAKRLGVKGQFVSANLFEDFDIEPYIGADVLILDPPRRGAKRICHQMQYLLPKKIIMISCDPAAGARDGALLASHGFRLKALKALDFFSYAGHVETASLWEPV